MPLSLPPVPAEDAAGEAGRPAASRTQVLDEAVMEAAREAFAERGEGPADAEAAVAASLVPGALLGLGATPTRLYGLAFAKGELVVYRSGLDGAGARVLGRVAASNGATYLEQSLRPAPLLLDGGFVYFADQGTLTGDVSAETNPLLRGVRGEADGAVYRLPQ